MPHGFFMNALYHLMVVFILVSVVGITHAETISYTDKLGRAVNVPVPVRRAVFFQTYELIPVLGVWNKVVGIGRYAYANDLMKASKPDIAKTVPSAGSGIDVNMEALLTLKPDIVITWTSRPEQVRFIEEKGLRVIAIYPDSLSELYGVMEFHGKIFKKEKEIKRAISAMDGMFGIITKRVSKIPTARKQKVLWISSRPNSVACRIGVTNDIINMIGGINPASSIGQRNADVSLEKIIKWNPDVIFIWGNAKYSAQDILNNPQWRYINAVKKRRVYKAPEWSTWSPRLAPIALWMAMKTYPQEFRDINFDATADVFYRKVFGIPYRMVARIEN
ncbi:MAG: ABC transporter substrate-binding protein [Syntrophaceae bacterium]